MSKDAVPPLSQSPLLRLLVLSPLALSGGASLTLVALAPSAWGAGAAAGLASWAPSVSALALGLPLLAISASGLVAVWRRLSGRFEVDMFGAVVGGATHWLAGICVLTIAGTMGSPGSYDSVGSGGASTAGFLFLAAVAAVLGCILLAGLTLVYVWAITPGRQTRIADRAEGEVDFVEEWTRRRPR